MILWECPECGRQLKALEKSFEARCYNFWRHKRRRVRRMVAV